MRERTSSLFGTVLYEIATGKRAFESESRATLLAPSWNTSHLAWALTCLFASIAALFALLYFRKPPAAAGLVRFSISRPENVTFSDPLAYASGRNGHMDLPQKAANGASGEESLVKSDEDKQIVPLNFCK